MLPKTSLAESELLEKRARLARLLRELGSVVVCFSGGVDSAVVLAIAAEALGERAIGLTAVGPGLAQAERVDAARIAASLGVAHRFVASAEMARPGYVANGPDRCFHCKTELYELAKRKGEEWGFAEVVNGANVDDLDDYRPGLEAARLAGARSPLIEAGFNKAEVREVARLLGLDVWDKPAAACLASRLPYGSRVTSARLGQIEGFEAGLRALGFLQVRVRWHEAIARIEVALTELGRLAEPALRQRVLDLGLQHGFHYVTVDLAGYRLGSHNEVLSGGGLVRRLPVVP